MLYGNPAWSEIQDLHSHCKEGMLIVSTVVSVCVCVVSDYVYACNVITINVVSNVSRVVLHLANRYTVKF